MVLDRDVTMNETEAPPPTSPAPYGAPPPPPTLGALRAVLIFLAFLAVQFVVVVAAAAWVGAGHGRDVAGSGEDGLRIAPAFLLAAALGGTALSGLVGFWLARRALPGPGAMAVIGWAPAPARDCGRAALEGLALVVVLGVVGAFLPPPTRGLGPLGKLDELGAWSKLAAVVLVLGVAPVVEELMFRGVLYTGLARRLRPGIAARLTTLAFVALHLPQLGGYWPGWLFIALVGALALRARVATGSLLPAVALHLTYNAGLVLAAAIAR
jgi:membrane protease YdiL (CAAX protease family)